MSLVQINYQPVNSGLGDQAPVAAAKINQAFVETDTALANANAALAAAGSASTTANTALTTANGFSTQIATLNTEVGTLNTTVTTLAGEISGISGGQTINASSWPGIDKTGVTSSAIAFQSLLVHAVNNIASGTPTTIVIDCPLYYSTGNNPANTLFWPSNVNLRGTPDGMLIVDHAGVAFCFMCHVSNITFQDLHIQLRQPMSNTVFINANPNTPWMGTAGSFQSNYLGGSTGSGRTSNNITFPSNGPGYLNTVCNITFSSGGTPLWAGPTALTATFNIRGNSSNINFTNVTFDVPQGANPAAFYSTVFSFNSEFLPGTPGSPHNVTSGTAQNPTTIGIPGPINFTNCTIDGAVMGMVGTGNINFNGMNFVRYSDTQDGTLGTITFQSALTHTSTTATLASAWTLPSSSSTSPPTPYWVQLGNGQVVGMQMTNGSVGCTNFIDMVNFATTTIIDTMVFSSTPGNGATSGTLSGWTLGRGTFTVNFTNGQTGVTVTVTYSGSTYTASFAALTSACSSATQTLVVGTTGSTGWVGGMPTAGSNGYYLGSGQSSAPPHAIYFPNSNLAFTNNYNVLRNVMDYGIRVYNTPYSRSMTNSGNACSCKLGLSNGTIVDGWHTERPDGGFDLESFGQTLAGAVVKNITCIFNSATPQIDYINNTPVTPLNGSAGSPVFGIRHPGTVSYENVVEQNVTMIDQNPSPRNVGFFGPGFTPNQNCSITGLKIFLQDWGFNSGQPMVYWAGTNIELEASIFFNSHSSQSTYVGYVPASSVFNQNSKIHLTYYGWRTIPIALASTISNATSATLSNASVVGGFPSGWPFSTSQQFKVFFADNSVRYCTISSANPPVMSWTGQAGVTATSAQLVGITAQGLYYSNFASYKPRISLPISQGQSSTRLIIDDIANQYYADTNGNCVNEQLFDDQLCIPLAGTTSFTTTLQIFGQYDLTSFGVCTNTALGTTGGLTGYTVGWSGSTAAIYTNSSTAVHANNSSFNATTLAAVNTAAGSTTRTVLITAVGGTFDGTGSILLSYRAAGTTIGT